MDLENQLEAEQEYIVNKLSKQVEELKKEKLGLQEERKSLSREKDTLGAENTVLRKNVRPLLHTRSIEPAICSYALCLLS